MYCSRESIGATQMGSSTAYKTVSAAKGFDLLHNSTLLPGWNLLLLLNLYLHQTLCMVNQMSFNFQPPCTFPTRL